ncbi:hypothetical protein BLA29_009757, partial [Euroglyphus maynei]
ENFSHNETDEDFKCAFYYKLLYACFKNHENTMNDNATKLDKIKNLIKSFVNDRNDELLFLAKCEALFVELNQPQSKLNHYWQVFKRFYEQSLLLQNYYGRYSIIYMKMN